MHNSTTWKSLSILAILIFCFILRAQSQDLETIKDQKPFTFHGNTGLNLMGYDATGIEARQKPFSFILTANATASVYGIEFPFSFSISDKQKSYSQPFNQFGLSPHWRWITVHGGYRNLTFSNFTMAGHTFLGGGIELTPGIFRFGFLYGRFDRKTTENQVYQNDSLPGFARRGFAVKVGVGTQENFCDLILLRVRDDSTSLHQSDTSAIRTPEQNVVVGLNSHFTFFKKLIWEVEGAFSLYTTNMGAESLQSIEDNKTLRSLNKFLVINQSSEYYSAVRSSLQYKARLWSVKLEYKRIDPKYRSMGAYFFNNDLQNITLTPAVSLWKRRLSLSGSIGLQSDNLRRTKKATSIRTIGSVNVSFNPSSTFGIDANYSNYALSQRDGRMPLTDSTRVHQITQNISVTPRLLFANTRLSHMIMLNYNFSNFNDKNIYTSVYSKFTCQTAQLNYSLGLVESRFSFLFGVTYSLTSNYLTDITGVGGTIGVTKSFLKDKLALSWNNSLVHTDIQPNGTWVFNSNIISSYNINTHNALRFNFYYTGNFTQSNTTTPTFNEFKGDLSYVYTF
jgi:hypothetical protein